MIETYLDTLTRTSKEMVTLLKGESDRIEAAGRALLRREEEVAKERKDLIEKQNTVLTQLRGLRGTEEAADKKMKEATRLKDLSAKEFEEASLMKQDLKTLEIEIQARKSKIVLLEEREATCKSKEKELTTVEADIAAREKLLAQERELLNEKALSISLREKRVNADESRLRRAMQ